MAIAHSASRFRTILSSYTYLAFAAHLGAGRGVHVPSLPAIIPSHQGTNGLQVARSNAPLTVLPVVKLWVDLSTGYRALHLETPQPPKPISWVCFSPWPVCSAVAVRSTRSWPLSCSFLLCLHKIISQLDLKGVPYFLTVPVSQPRLGLDNQGCRLGSGW